MEYYIVKFIPKDDTQQRVIHKIKMPEILEQGFYRLVRSFDAFRSGKRKDARKAEAEYFRDTCGWAPTGLYSTTDFIEAEWRRNNADKMESLKRLLKDDADEHDETKWPCIIHEHLYDFYKHIGFDRKKRSYPLDPS